MGVEPFTKLSGGHGFEGTNIAALQDRRLEKITPEVSQSSE